MSNSGESEGEVPGVTAGLWSDEFIWIISSRRSRSHACQAEPLRWLLARRLSGSWMIRSGTPVSETWSMSNR